MIPPCVPKMLPRDQWLPAAHQAIKINPANRPRIELLSLVQTIPPTAEHLAVVTSKLWHTNGVNLTVSFMDVSDPALQDRIVGHMNAWAAKSNVNCKFTKTATVGQVRIATKEQSGYWSYLGTDILSIPPNQQTMNLQNFTMGTPESEYHRVVRHETGHTLGFPHEHMRSEIVSRLDVEKTVAWFAAHVGWDHQTVIQQVLTPLEESSLLGTPHADITSIMCYQLPAEITKDGQPIPGGLDIDDLDYSFAASIYPASVNPPPPPPPPPPVSPCRKVARAIFRGVQAAGAEMRGGAAKDSGGSFVDFLDRFCPKILGG